MLYPRPCLPERMRAADQFTPTRRGEPRSGPLESRNGQQENHIRSPPNQAVTNPDVAECIRYSDLWCDSFDWRERFVWLRGDGRRNERKASRLLRVQHKFEFRFIDLFLVFSFPPTHPAIGIVYRIDGVILLLFSLRCLSVVSCKRSGGERRLAGLPDD